MDDLDRILVSDDVVSPSPRFAADVMDAVAAASSEPPPLPFPWRRYTTGVLACAAWTGSVVWLIALVDVSALDVAITELAAVKTELGYAAAVLASLALQRLLAFSLVTLPTRDYH